MIAAEEVFSNKLEEGASNDDIFEADASLNDGSSGNGRWKRIAVADLGLDVVHRVATLVQISHPQMHAESLHTNSQVAIQLALSNISSTTPQKEERLAGHHYFPFDKELVLMSSPPLSTAPAGKR